LFIFLQGVLMNTNIATWGLETFLLIAFSFFLVIMLFSKMRKLADYRSKYSPLIDKDVELKKLAAATEKQQAKIIELQSSYSKKFETYEKLKNEVGIFNDQIEYANIAFYEPHFDFDSSEEFKQKIKEVRDNQKTLISNKTAIEAQVAIEVGNSKSKGRQLINKQIKLSLRAFNNECDAAIGNVRWNNVDQMKKRIERSREAIDKLNESLSIVISEKFYQLKITELLLSHEYREAKQVEKEKSLEIKRLQREEQKLLKDAENASKEQSKFQKLLDKAKKQAEKAAGEKLEALQSEITQLENSLAETKDKSERALSMAQKTRAGHIYVISNRGSFGEDVIKIGMTRRLDPIDRIKELGDASVPFTFDLHALIYTEDAPSLEAELHDIFDQYRVNLVNNRKEFFKVSLDKVQAEIQKLDVVVDFIFDAEAREYKESLAKTGSISMTKIETKTIPSSI
jgi:hypothetical protein